ncbi:peptidyl-tRNA hydrolase [Candidatus Amesbacteria bacterium]|nr:peptidyl-tRNA hydrolase [Candidatus Amesbacteria bacterium]
MKIIIGLGNPGVEYQLTRHNSGVMLVDKMADIWRKHYGAMVCKKDNLWLVKTKDVFMNESGKLLQGLPEGELWVAHDDLDIKLGEYKVQKGRGPKEHNGVKSIEDTLGTKGFWRIRIGIENRSMTNVQSGEDYVLQRFTREERDVLEGVLDEIIETNF